MDNYVIIVYFTLCSINSVQNIINLGSSLDFYDLQEKNENHNIFYKMMTSNIQVRESYLLIFAVIFLRRGQIISSSIIFNEKILSTVSVINFNNKLYYVVQANNFWPSDNISENVTVALLSVPPSAKIQQKNLVNQDQIDNFICWICKQVANIPIEIDCPQHQSLDEVLLVGENCLKHFLNSNPNSCPVQHHDSCLYSRSGVIQRQIDALKVICPLQFQQRSLTYSQEQGHEKVVCDFKGKIKELHDHLENACPLKLLDCWYKPFGCDHTYLKHKLQDHLTSQLKPHFDLAVKFVDSLQQTIQLYQVELLEEIRQLKVQLGLHEKVNEENSILISENAALKKEISQLQQDILQLNSSKVFFVCLFQETLVGIEKIKNEIVSKKDEMKKMNKAVELKQKELLEKYNEIQNIQKEYHQELLKLRDGVEDMKKDFSKKEDKLLHYDQLISSCKKRMANSLKIFKSFPVKTNKKTMKLFYLFLLNCLEFSLNTPALWKVFNILPLMLVDFFALRRMTQFVYGTWIPISKFRGLTAWTQDLKIFGSSPHFVNNAKLSSYHRTRPTFWTNSKSRNSIIFRDLKTTEESQTLEGHNISVNDIQFSPFTGGRYLCSGSVDKTVRLWDVKTSKSLHVFNGHENWIRCVEFSPLQTNDNKCNSVGVIGGNGYTICSGSGDNTIRLWDIETLKELLVFREHTELVRSIQYSRNEISIVGGNVLCSGSSDKTIRLWDIRTGVRICLFKGHTETVSAVKWLPCENNGNAAQIICSGSFDNTIRFWDIRSMKQLHQIKGFDDDYGICCLEFLSFEKFKKSANGGCGYILCYGTVKGIIRLLS
ncbi:WD-40 repeat protein [Reticulomyxa filosa]|uniref:WD-40 repeat protein n=1 Tax=Reticulomyxa filosa TaxID=46433 RepID=X6N4U1_RETFI|nr:WD-40 repeat protein [Reticulomyxa filosa]|eukprot:ETO20779.1 WD-40 repeat protein [Reticulomyxa filosa]